MNTIEKNEECIDACNSLLRGERSAVETYDKAIEKFNSEPSSVTLREIRETHAKAVTILEENVRSMGGTPDPDSGTWGTFANIVQSTANFFGEESAITALQQGEEHGKRDYENTLENDDVMPACKDMMRTKLLPNVLSNIATLEALEEAV